MRTNSCVWEDSLAPERVCVCEPFAAGSRAVAAGGVQSSSGVGAGMSRGSRTGWAVRGASVELAGDPGEYQTNSLSRPPPRIENIRTSKYDRCSDTLGPAGGPDHPGLRTGVQRTNATNKL